MPSLRAEGNGRRRAKHDRAKALRDFDDAFFGHVSFTLSNVVRSFVYGLTGGAFIAKPRTPMRRCMPYYRAATRISTAFALLADVSMFVLGGDLKRRERISARLGDVLSQLYLISATLKRFEDEGRQEEDLPLVRWGVEDALYKAQQALDGVLANYPNRLAAGLVRVLAFPFGLPHREPSDRLGSAIAELMQTPGAARERLVADSYVPHPDVDRARLRRAAVRAEPALHADRAETARSGQARPARTDAAEPAATRRMDRRRAAAKA